MNKPQAERPETRILTLGTILLCLLALGLASCGKNEPADTTATPKADSAPKEEQPPKPAKPPKPGEPLKAGEVIGIYVPDEEAVRMALKEWLSEIRLPPGMTREQMNAQIETRIDSHMADWSMELVLEPEGTFTMTADIGFDTTTTRGTWAVDGPELKMQTTHENGIRTSPPSQISAEFADGRITLRQSLEYPVVLQRK